MSTEALRILVADDDATTRLLMQAALVRAGYQVVLAEDGERALRQFSARSCDMVMLDVDMPGLNGYEVCARLRREAGEELPIVMVTGMDDVNSIEHAFAAGATDFIAKPIHWPLIGHRVRYLFRAGLVLQDLHAANARNAAMLTALPDTLLRLGVDGEVLDARGAGPQRGPLAATGRSLAASFPAEAVGRILAAATEARKRGAPMCLELSLALDGEPMRHFEARLATIDDQQTLCVLRDITERKEAEVRIHRLAYFDALTGLPNRQSFAERLDREVMRNSGGSNRMAVLFMDLDRFKNVNDTLGHGAGDLLLQAVTDRLRQAVRSADLVARSVTPVEEVELARQGGDEFTVLLPNIGHGDDAWLVAQRIQHLMHRPFHLQGRDVVVTASIGIAIFPDDGVDASSLLKNADTAMYHAKEEGRDNCKFYRSALTDEVMHRLDMQSRLHLAIERGEFFLVYQPQLDSVSGRVYSVEALIRWRHPELGLIPPVEFIPISEENGLIVPIGEWVMRTACAQAACWQNGGQAVRVAVNLSAVQFRNPGLVALISQILDETGLAPHLLELELTEGVLMGDSEGAMHTLNALRALGLQLSLDDFGTGYSSLSYLKRLPLNNLKVDRSFVNGLPADKESMAIVGAIVAMAKKLGFTVTAEGVETVEQAHVLLGMDCEMLQGYYISRPVPAVEIAALVSMHQGSNPSM